MHSLHKFILLGFLTAAPSAFAATINFSNEFSGPGELVDSDGQPLTDPEFTVELGFFSSTTPRGLRPTWRSQWTTLETATINSADSFFSGTWTDNSGNFEGRQLSLWINNRDFSGTVASEWSILTSNDWVVLAEMGQETPVLNFLVAETTNEPDTRLAEVAIFGEAFDLTGSGERTVERPAGATIQTFFAPEPSSALLTVLGTLTLLRRKR